MVTSYNLVLAVCAICSSVVHRARAHALLAAGSVLFLGASVACALADCSRRWWSPAPCREPAGAAARRLGARARCARGLDDPRVAIWVTAGTIGAAVGPALGGLLTQVFDWRAIFLAQAPVAAAALLATAGWHLRAILEERLPPLRRTMPANLGLALVSGSLVGALFLGVLLVIDVYGYSPIQGAAIVSTIPIGAVLARPLAAALPASLAIGAERRSSRPGSSAWRCCPRASRRVLASLGLCGVGLGLSVPGLTHAALEGRRGRPGQGHARGRDAPRQPRPPP